MRTSIVRHDHELGSSVRAVRLPNPALAPLLYRPLYGFELREARFASWLEPPRPAVTLMIDLEGRIEADGERVPDAWLGGLGDRYSMVGLEGGRYASLDIELTPLGAYSMLGCPLSEIAGRCAALEDLFGAAGRRLAERVRGARDWDERFDVLEAFVRAQVAQGPSPTPAVEWALARMWASGGKTRIEALAAELGCSRRYLAARFRVEVGLAPKAIARQIRFRRVCSLIERDPGSWAQIAAAAGYYDQPHLNRDFRELAGCTPAEFVARLIPGGGVLGDGIPFFQDAQGHAA